MTRPDYRNTANRATTRYMASKGSKYLYFEYKQPGYLLGYRNDFKVQTIECSVCMLQWFLEVPIALRGIKFHQMLTGYQTNKPVVSPLNAWQVTNVFSKLSGNVLLPAAPDSKYCYFKLNRLYVTAVSNYSQFEAPVSASQILAFSRTDLTERDQAFANLLAGH